MWGIGKLDPPGPGAPGDVTVIGGGIAGMLGARALLREGYRVRLLEASDRLGGLIATRQTPFGIAETAAHSFLASEPVLRLCQELGVELVGLNPGASARYIVRDGKPRRMPLKALELLATLWRAARPREALPGDATLADWAEHYLGRAARDYLIDPFTHGIYGVGPERLGLGLAFPALRPKPGQSLLAHVWGLERRPRPKMMAPLLGMGALVDALERDLRARGCEIELDHRVEKLETGANTVLAVPAPGAATLLESDIPVLTRAFRSVNYAPLTSATVFVQRSRLARRIDGVGSLIPSVEPDRPALGVLFNSSAFPGRVKDPETDSFTVMLANDRSLSKCAKEALRRTVGLSGEIEHMEISTWAQAVPTYGPELALALALARETLPRGRLLFGNLAGQLSLRAMIEQTCPLKSA